MKTVKKIASKSLAVLLALSVIFCGGLLQTAAYAAGENGDSDPAGNDLFTVNGYKDNGVCLLLSHPEYVTDGVLTVPATFGGYAVDGLLIDNYDSLLDLSGIDAVVLPSGIEHVYIEAGYNHPFELDRLYVPAGYSGENFHLENVRVNEVHYGGGADTFRYDWTAGGAYQEYDKGTVYYFGEKLFPFGVFGFSGTEGNEKAGLQLVAPQMLTDGVLTVPATFGGYAVDGLLIDNYDSLLDLSGIDAVVLPSGIEHVYIEAGYNHPFELDRLYVPAGYSGENFHLENVRVNEVHYGGGADTFRYDWTAGGAYQEYDKGTVYYFGEKLFPFGVFGFSGTEGNKKAGLQLVAPQMLTDGVLTVPATFGGYAVDGLLIDNRYSLLDLSGIDTVVLPSGIEHVYIEAGYNHPFELDRMYIPAQYGDAEYAETYFVCNNVQINDVYFDGARADWPFTNDPYDESGTRYLNYVRVHFAVSDPEDIEDVLQDGIVAEGNSIYGITPGMTVSELGSIFDTDGALVSVSSCNGTHLGTGSVVTVELPDGSVEEFEIVVFGDTTGDAYYDGTDATLVAAIAAGMLTEDDVGRAVYTAADCNHDGTVDSFDVEILNSAGVLLTDVDQTKTSEELLETSSAFREYVSLISTVPGPSQEEPCAAETQFDFAGIITFFFRMISDFISGIRALLF